MRKREVVERLRQANLRAHMLRAEGDALVDELVPLRAEVERLRAELRNLRTEVPVGVAAVATIERVKALHHESPEHFEGCGTSCRGCHEVWPCPTIKALDGPEPATSAPEPAAGHPAPTDLAAACGAPPQTGQEGPRHV